jgi:carboxypeptidase Q
MPFSVSDGYMLYHHTEADTIDKLDPAQMQTVAATNAIWALSVANLPGLLPRA